MSKAEIARETGLSVATASRLSAGLLHEGFLKPAGEAPSRGGRPSQLLELNSLAATTLVLDVRGPETEVAVVDIRGNVHASRRTRGATDPAERVTQTVELAVAGLERARGDGLRCVAAGVSIPGPVEPDGTVAFAPALSWRRVALGRQLEDALGVPVAVDNDANLLALAEYQHGRAAGVGALVSVAVFEGVGLGIIEDGRVWRGGHGGAGQLGRTLYDTSALATNFTGYGDLETRLGSVGIARRAQDAGIASGSDEAVLEQLISRYRSGNPAARELLGRVFDEFAMALTNLCAILDPECIVLCGLFQGWAPVVIPQLTHRLAPHVLNLPDLQPATSGLQATLVGAGHVALENSGGLAHLL